MWTRAFPSKMRSFGDVEVVVGRAVRAVDGCMLSDMGCLGSKS
jgi:hypothetical protein